MPDTDPTLTPPAPWLREYDGAPGHISFYLHGGEVSVTWWPEGISGSGPYVSMVGVLADHQHIPPLLAWLATGPVLPALPRPTGGAS